MRSPEAEVGPELVHVTPKMIGWISQMIGRNKIDSQNHSYSGFPRSNTVLHEAGTAVKVEVPGERVAACLTVGSYQSSHVLSGICL